MNCINCKCGNAWWVENLCPSCEGNALIEGSCPADWKDRSQSLFDEMFGSTDHGPAQHMAHIVARRAVLKERLRCAKIANEMCERMAADSEKAGNGFSRAIDRKGALTAFSIYKTIMAGPK